MRISNSAPASTLRKSSPLHNKVSPPPIVDRFEPSSPQATPDLSQAKSLFQPAESTGKRAAKAFGYGLALTLGLVGGTASVQAATSTEAVQNTAVQRALRNPKAKALIARLPSSIAKEASSLSDAQARVLKGGIEGYTKVGPVSVSNRKAFVKGTVFGKSVWSEVSQQMRDARSKHGMINAAEEKQLLKIIDQASKMSKGQREVMAQVMDYVVVR